MLENDTPRPEVTNPYAPTCETAAMGEEVTEPEAIRRKYIKHETSIKSIGAIYLFAAIGCGIVVLLVWFSPMNPRLQNPREVMFGAIFTSLALLLFVTAIGLYRFRAWARWMGVVLAVIGSLNIPIGTILSFYFLYLLLSAKSSFVFSSEYSAIRIATPHVKYKTPTALWVFALVLLLVVASLIVLGLPM